MMDTALLRLFLFGLWRGSSSRNHSHFRSFVDDRYQPPAPNALALYSAYNVRKLPSPSHQGNAID